MASDRDVAFLLDQARLGGAKVVMVGDDRQLGAVSVGGAMGAVVERHGGVVHTLDQNVRQHDEAEREALAELRAGDVSRTVGRASLDLATLGLKGRSLISLPVRLRRSGFYPRRSDTVSAKRPATRHDALRRRWTELLGQLLGRNCCATPVPQYRGYTGESIPQRHMWGSRRSLPTDPISGSCVR
jgi:hypothetical protein